VLIFIGSRRQTYLLRTMRRDERMPAWTCRTYQWLFRTRMLPAGTYIFVGVDRLDAGERRLGGQFYRHINSLRPGFRALNDPAVAMGRYRLLRTLYEQGINDFNAYLAAETARPERYPVFIRRNSTSTTPLSELIENGAALDNAIDKLIVEGEPPEDLLIIEFCSEPMDGVYHKQAEFRVGDRYAPNATQHSDNWYVKRKNRIDVPDALYHRDAEIVAKDPYAEPMRRVFEIAQIEYGRADFGFANGRPQVYEVNFNPELTTQRQRGRPHPLDRANWEESDSLMFAAMRAIDSNAKGSAPSLTNDELRQFRLRFWRNYAPQRY